MALLLKADGTTERVFPKAGTEFTLEELQGYVGGMIELVPTTKIVVGTTDVVLFPKGSDMYINEEGKILNLPFNAMATGAYLYGNADPIVGDALICEKGETS